LTISVASCEDDDDENDDDDDEAKSVRMFAKQRRWRAYRMQLTVQFTATTDGETDGRTDGVTVSAIAIECQ